MPRKNTSDELWDAVSEAGYLRDVAAGATGLVDTEAAADQKLVVLGVGEGASFTAADLVRIGTGEKLEVGQVASIAVDTLTLDSNLAFTHVVTTPVVEQEKVAMGHVAEGGITQDSTATTVEIPAATSAVPLVDKLVSVSMSILWPGLNMSMENLAVIHGIPESALSGARTLADPDILDLKADAFQSLKNTSLYFTGVLEDGANVEIRGHNVAWSLDKSTAFARNAAAEFPTGGVVKSVRYMQWV